MVKHQGMTVLQNKFMQSFTLQYKSFLVGRKQVLTKLIEKKVRDKRFIKNSQPNSLLNENWKLISKKLACRLKNVISNMLMKIKLRMSIINRFTIEGRRLISDVLEITNFLDTEDFLLTVDTEKAFDSINDSSVLYVLQKIGFGSEFTEWIKLLIKKPKQCIINDDKTTPYIQLKKGTRRGDPISAYVFFLASEVIFALIKANPNNEGLSFFSYNLLHYACVKVTNTFHWFSVFTGLKINKENCQIVGIGVKKSVKVALCRLECIDLKRRYYENFTYLLFL